MIIKCPYDRTLLQKEKIKIKYYDGIEVESEGYRCPKCGEKYLTGPQSEKFGEVYHAAKKAAQQTIAAKNR
nr:hypothetical protein [Candidatus Freyarchaeota archaeon]